MTAARLRPLLVFVAVTLVLLAVFWLYTRPEFLVALSEQMWACFQ